MKLTAKQLRKMIKEELNREGVFDKLKGSLGMGTAGGTGTKEEVIAQIKKINKLAIELDEAVAQVTNWATQTGQFSQELDQDSQFEARAIKTIDDMARVTRAARKMSTEEPGPGHEFAFLGQEMSPI
tara:strand:+ start:527 stop:907 length:381 start_codon:yes stop_codon:yes gene_type:complete